MSRGLEQCPVCGGDPRRRAFPYATEWCGRCYEYRRCSGCRSVYVTPTPSREVLLKLYSGAYYEQLGGGEQPEDRGLDLLVRRMPEGAELLDFGCGDGSFLRKARERGFQPSGVEYNADVVEALRRRLGFPIYESACLDVLRTHFDVIAIRDVLHHLTDPVSTLAVVAGLLRPGGVLLVEGPLEVNPDPVYLAALVHKAFERLTGTFKPANRPPTMLFRTSAKTQRDFFRERLGWTERHFEVYATGWPYRRKGGAIGPTRDGVRQLIGTISVHLSGRRVLGIGPFGNRFTSLYEVDSGD